MLKIEDKITGEDTIDFSGRYLKECYKLLNFVGNYYKMRADKRSKIIHSLINKNLDERFHKNTLSQKSVMLLNSIDGVDCVLTGIRKESYVDDICEILNSEKILNAKEIIQFVSKEIEYSDT